MKKKMVDLRKFFVVSFVFVCCLVKIFRLRICGRVAILGPVTVGSSLRCSFMKPRGHYQIITTTLNCQCIYVKDNCYYAFIKICRDDLSSKRILRVTIHPTAPPVAHEAHSSIRPPAPHLHPHPHPHPHHHCLHSPISLLHSS